ncbi:hypothetical protein Leryth_016579 [Lithospermum erythrorhizon]|nr:hypothetical protein Leryth_016579 [Lithospermum erythrorhizon]
MLTKNISNINMSNLVMTSSSGIHQRKDEVVDRDMVTPIKAKEESNLIRNRPPRLIVPGSPALGSSAGENKMGGEDIEMEGRHYSVASKKGRRKVMEDAHSVIVDLFGNHKQALFMVIDGHGGRGTADFVKKNLGRNIIKELKDVRMTGNNAIERAYRRGHLLTDEQIIFQSIGGGACAASVLVMGGQLHIANVGDCRVVLSRNGKAVSLTKDHRPSRHDERLRIDKSGGYVTCRNGVWRVNGTLAVSRAFGDRHMKKFIISDPEIKRLPLTSDCEFLIMASDGLWDKVDEQEAVELVSSEMDSLESCKKLVDISFSRGNDDDITVMIINLKHFVT